MRQASRCSKMQFVTCKWAYCPMGGHHSLITAFPRLCQEMARFFVTAIVCGNEVIFELRKVVGDVSLEVVGVLGRPLHMCTARQRGKSTTLMHVTVAAADGLSTPVRMKPLPAVSEAFPDRIRRWLICSIPKQARRSGILQGRSAVRHRWFHKVQSGFLA